MASLVVRELLFFVVFVSACLGYGTAAGRLLKSKTGKAVLGFVTMLVIWQIIATPILYTHGSFDLFFIFFVLTIAAGLILFALGLRNGTVFCFEGVGASLRSPFTWIALVLILTHLVLTTVNMKFDYDDSFYISLMEQNIGDSALYSYDPSTGDRQLPFQPFYLLQSWELVIAGWAHLFQIPVLVLAHTLLPVLMIALSYLAYARLFGEVAKGREAVAIMIIFLGMFHFMGGYAHRSQGNFIAYRLWQGKAVVLHVLLPILQYYLLTYIREPKRNAIIAMFLVNIAGFALNPSAMFLFAIVILSLTTVGLLTRHITIGNAFRLLYSVLPFAFFGLLLYQPLHDFVQKWPGASVEEFRFNEEVKLTLGTGALVSFFVIVILLLGWRMKRGSAKNLLFWNTLFLMVLVINPWVGPFWAEHFTSGATYWRVLWLIPCGPGLAYIGYRIVQAVQDKFFKARERKGWVVRLVTVLACCGLMTFGGEFVFSEHNAFTPMTSAYKIPPDVLEIGERLRGDQPVVVAAPEEVAVYLRGIASNSQVVFSRDLYMVGFLSLQSTEYKERKQLFDLTNTPQENSERLRPLLHKYHVNYIVCQKEQVNLIQQLEQLGAKRVQTYVKYVLFAI